MENWMIGKYPVLPDVFFGFFLCHLPYGAFFNIHVYCFVVFCKDVRISNNWLM